jgi:fructose-1,6-bisphosphatase/inositol monophosphatase family enzyme
MTVQPAELRSLLDEATSLVARAAELVRRRVQGTVAFHRKADRTWVSEIDLEVEAMLRAELERRFPGDGILGEERGLVRAGAPRRWLLDPIDGTRSLRHGIPLYGTILGLEVDGEPLLGVIALPALGRLYGAARGVGAFRDGEPLRQTPPLPDGPLEEVIALGERRQFNRPGAEEAFARLMAAHPGARIYPDCFAHALAAEGAVGAMVDFDLRPWDLGASRVLVEEAGGRYLVVAQRGEGPEARRDVVLGKPAVVEWVAATIAGKPRAADFESAAR